MKLNRLAWALVLVWASVAVEVPGQLVDPDRAEFEAIRAKAESGDGEAQLNLAWLYSNGKGVSKDKKKAAKWLRKAADQGLAPAQCLLGLRYANGEGVKLDKTEGARWLRKAADQGLAEAQYDLGVCYANGDGVGRSAVEAALWYRKAADQGLADAECELGNCYLEGIGVPKDIPEGVKWTQRAAEQGNGLAQKTLGVCYMQGKGVAKDYVQAYRWLNLAAAKGDLHSDDARVSLAMTERFLTAEQVAEGQRLAREFKPRKGAAPEDSASGPAKGAGGGHGWVQVTAEDAAGEIFVDGAFVGNTPAKVKLGEGAHVVEVKKAGFKDYRKEIKVTEGAELSLRVVLEKQ